jgi:hypothetical protein
MYRVSYVWQMAVAITHPLNAFTQPYLSREPKTS